MIRLLRRMVANLLRDHPDLTVNDMKLSETVQLENLSMERFTEEVILRDKEEARLGIHAVIPLALRVSTMYVYLDSSDRTDVLIPG